MPHMHSEHHLDLGMFVVTFSLVSSTIVFINTYTRNHYSLVCYPPRFLLLPIRTYMRSSPVTTGDASYFDVS